VPGQVGTGFGIVTDRALTICGEDWPAWRGPQHDGRARGDAVFASEHLALEVVWRRPLGSGYSGISVAGGRVVTQFTDGDQDWVAALDVSTGNELWRASLGPTYAGHDVSKDGPVSTPAVAGDAVYALGPRGNLLALALADGAVRWSRRLDEELGAVPSGFGFATSPLVVDDLVVVATGGAGGSFTALARSDGAVRWRSGDDRVEYQSPVLAELYGIRQVLALGDDRLLGLEPASGTTLWSLDYAPGDRSSTSAVVPVPGDALLINPWPDTALFAARRDGDGWAFDERWREGTLGARLATSVWHEGHVYGFDGNFLTCVDGNTGVKAWKSRPPGGSGLILVEGHLVMLARGGDVVLARAAPEGYVERARVKALEDAGVTYPSFADGVVYVRDTREIAAVRVRAGEKPTAAGSGPADGAIAALLAAVADAEVKRSPVDDFMRRHPVLPVVEGGRLHFVWRGAAEDVGIEASHLGWAEEPLARIPGTDLWYRTDEVPAGLRIEYRFNVDFEHVGPDPANPFRVPAEWGEDYSVVATPPWSEPSFAGAPAGVARGRLESSVHSSAVLGNDRNIKVWLPEAEARGLAIVTEGETWIEKGLFLDVVRNLAGAGTPVAVVFVGETEQGGEGELAGERTPDYVRMLADELIPAIASRHGIRPSAASTAVLGRWTGGHAAIVAGLSRPDVFGHVLAASVLARDQREALVARIAADPPSGARFRLVWSIRERWDGGETTRALYDALRNAGFAVDGGERLDGAGWGVWRVQAGEALVADFP